MDERRENIILEYGEFGKIFNFPYKTTDYEILDSSDRNLAVRLFDEIYLPDIANYGVRNLLKFNTEPPNYGNYSVILQPYHRIPDKLLFIQVQQRTELDYLLRQSQLLEGNTLPNRLYTQAHITLIPKKSLAYYLKNKFAIYDSLLFKTQNGYALKDYGVFDRSGKVVNCQLVSRSVQLQQHQCQAEDAPYVKGLTDILFTHIRRAIIEKRRRDDILHNIVVVTPELSMARRLAIIQSVQMRLLPIIDIFTFALDYAIAPGSQIYFCADYPNQNFLYNATTYTTSDLLDGSARSVSYYDMTEQIGLEGLSEPSTAVLILKGVPANEALVLTDSLKNGVQQNGIVVSRALLKNLSVVDATQISSIVEGFAASQSLASALIAQINTIKLSSDQRHAIYQQLLTSIAKSLPVSIMSFLDSYLLIREQDPAFTQLQHLLMTVVLRFPDLVFEAKSLGKQEDFLYELLDINLEQGLTLKNGDSLLARIFGEPSDALFLAINRFCKDKKWSNDYQAALVGAIFSQTKQWSPEDIQQLLRKTPVQIPKLGYHQLVTFLRSQKSINNFQSLPEPTKIDRLGELINNAKLSSGSILQSLSEPSQFKILRELALSLCNPNSRKNLNFTMSWLKEMRVLESAEFASDLATIFDNSDRSQPLILFEKREKLLYAFLKGEKGGLDIAEDEIFRLCSEFHLDNHYLTILSLVLKRNRIIPVKDLKRVVDELPATNKLASDIVKSSYNQPELRKSLGLLSEETARAWLDKTNSSELRRSYLFNANPERTNKMNFLDLLYETLFTINSASQSYLIAMLTIDQGFWLGVSDMHSYNEKVDRLLKLRPDSDHKLALALFHKMVQALKIPSDYKIGDMVIFTGELALRAESGTQHLDLPDQTMLTELYKLAVEQAPLFANSFVTLLRNIAQYTNTEALINRYDPKLIVLCAEFIKMNNADGVLNKFVEAANSVGATGFHEVLMSSDYFC